MEAGTVLVKDILPGLAGSSPDGLVNVGGRVFFAAEDATNGRKLWTSDGTGVGTALVGTDSGLSNPSWLTSVGENLFLVADGALGSGLWIVGTWTT
jgi:ELWxxDGT repeat protein